MTNASGENSQDRDGVNKVPWPDGFGRPRPVFAVVATGLFAAAGAAFAAVAVVAVLNGELLRFGLGGGGMVFGIAGALVLTRRLRLRRPITEGVIVRAREADGTCSVAIPMDRTATVTLAMAFLGGAVFLVALAVGRMTGSGHSGQPFRMASGVFFIAVAIACAVLATLMIAMARAPRGLVLSESGIRQNNGALAQYLPWQSIAAVDAVDADPTEGSSRRRIPMVLVRPTTAADIAVPWRFRWFRQRTYLNAISVQPTAYSIDGGLLYYTLSFYWRHSELRGELASDIAVERMRRGEVMG